MTEKKYSYVETCMGYHFRYNFTDSLLELVYEEDEPNVWTVIDNIGLSKENWENGKTEYMEEYAIALDDEVSQMDLSEFL